MSFWQELNSWLSPSHVDVSSAPTPGSAAPSIGEVKIPYSDGKPVVVTFLRHCGCPFAEQTFREMRDAASKHSDVHYIAVSHSDESSTSKWLEAVGGAGNIKVIVDSERKIYGKYGLGVSGFGHVLSPSGLSAVYNLGKTKNIWNKPTESGSRWQTSGNYAIDGRGIVVWGGPANGANDVPDFEEVTKKAVSG